jgi:phosphomannomutase
MIGGSDLVKQEQQLGDNVLDMFDYVFPENGLIAYKDGKQVSEKMTLKDYLGEEKLRRFIDYCLWYLATQVKCPVKRGTFIEFRASMLNISPVGRNCSREERDLFEQYDQEHQTRKKMVEALKDKFPDYGLKYSIGGQISFDVFPIGWDKTYCLNHLRKEQFDKIYFFGDKTTPGGNDYELYVNNEVEGRSVQDGPNDTIKQCKDIVAHL